MTAMSAEREANVGFANDLLDAEIAQRNARKDAQENTARGVILSAGLVLTLLLGLAKDAGLFAPATSVVAQVALGATMVAGGAAAACAVGTLWPRAYDRLGTTGLVRFNDSAFLDQRRTRSRVRLSRPGSGLHKRWTSYTNTRPAG